MRTSEEIYHRVRWDARFDPARFVMGVMVRGAEPKRIPLAAFEPGGDIPWHRVLFIEADDEVVWDRATGVDSVGVSGAGLVRAKRLLHPPFFQPVSPYSWDNLHGWIPATAAPDAGPPPARLRVLSWNVLWDRYDGDRIDTARRTPLLLAALAESDADVIALQEVERDLLAQIMHSDWARAGYWLGGDPTTRDVDTSGLLLLSRLPVRESGRHEFGPHKAVTAITVDCAAGPVVVAAVHLSSDHSENGPARRRAELAELAKGMSGVDGDLVLVGDFNTGDDAPQRVLGMRDVWLERHGADDRTPTFDPIANPLAAVSSLTGRASRLDRVLVRANGPRVIDVQLAGDTPVNGLFASDHYGVLADLEWKTTATAAGRSAPTARTAVAWVPPPELWPQIQRIRERHDPSVDRWPPHVNVLFGFLPESDFDEAATALSAALARVAPFTAKLGGVHSFGHRDDSTIWLDPGSQGWAGLYDALTQVFPQCRTRRDAYTPHLTLGRTHEPFRLAAECEARLGEVSVLVDHLVLLSRRDAEPMQIRAVVGLGTGSVHWVPDEKVSGPSILDDPGEAPAAAIASALPAAVVHVVGSRRFGCALPGADLDLVVAVAGDTAIDEVRDRVGGAEPVVGARVPGLRLRRNRIGIDMAVVATGAIPPAQAVERRLELGDNAAIALSAVSDADAIVAAVAHTPGFARLARDVKAWARSRGLDSAPFGGIPGIGWAVLAARSALEEGELTPHELLRRFFATWAAWDWRKAVTLDGSDVSAVGPMTILTPSARVRSCTEQVGEAMRDLVTQELYYAWEDVTPPPLHRRHAAWAVLTVDAHTIGPFRGRMRALLSALESAGVTGLHAWPRPFTTSTGYKSFAIGLGHDPITADQLTRVAAPWLKTVHGVQIQWTSNGSVPTLRDESSNAAEAA